MILMCYLKYGIHTHVIIVRDCVSNARSRDLNILTKVTGAFIKSKCINSKIGVRKCRQLKWYRSISDPYFTLQGVKNDVRSFVSSVIGN